MAALAAALAWAVGATTAPTAQAGETGITIRGTRTAAGYVDIPKDVAFSPTDVLEAEVKGSYAVVELRKVGAPDVSAGVFAVPAFGAVKVGGWAPPDNRLPKGRYLVTLVTDGLAEITLHLCDLLELIDVPLPKASAAFATLRTATGEAAAAGAYELRHTVRVPSRYRAVTVSYVDALATSKAAACLVAKGATCAAGGANPTATGIGARQDIRTFQGSVGKATVMDAVGQFDGHVAPKAFGLFVAVFPA